MENERRQREYAVLLIAVVLFLIALVATIVVLSGDDEPVPSPSPEPSVTFVPEPTITPSIEPSIVLPPVLASGQDEDFVFNVMNVERDAPATVDGQVADGELTLVTLRVDNVGDEPLGFSTADVGALDSTGVLWMSDNVDESAVTVISGGDVTKVVVFDTAVGVDLVVLQATGSSAGSVATLDGVEIPLP